MKRFVTFILIFVLITGNALIPAYASSAMYDIGAGTLLDDISKTMPILEDVLKQKKDIIEEEFKKMIKDNGWDYELSIMAFEDAGNPYEKVDYNELIAA